MTREFEGFYADSVNIVLKETITDLEQAFLAIGWDKADSLSCKSAYGMIKNFILNRPYEKAPFSGLYLFGRRQDVGFQEAIGTRPLIPMNLQFGWEIVVKM
jgi:hypothetical protein